MSRHLLVVIVGIPLAWHLLLVAGTYWDAGRVPMNRTKWTLVVLLVPLFGFFAYLFERGELDYDPEEDPYAEGGVNVHESRADDVGLPLGDPELGIDVDEDESSEENDGGEADRGWGEDHRWGEDR